MKKVVLLIVLLAIAEFRTVTGLGECIAWSEVTSDSRKGLSWGNSPVRWRWQKVVPQTFPWHVSMWRNWELCPRLILTLTTPFESLGLVCRKSLWSLFCFDLQISTHGHPMGCNCLLVLQSRVGSIALLVVTGNVLHQCWAQNYLWMFLRIPLYGGETFHNCKAASFTFLCVFHCFAVGVWSWRVLPFVGSCRRPCQGRARN